MGPSYSAHHRMWGSQSSNLGIEPAAFHSAPLKRSQVLPGMVIREARQPFQPGQRKEKGAKGTTGELQGALRDTAGPELLSVAPSQPQRKLLPVLSLGQYWHSKRAKKSVNTPSLHALNAGVAPFGHCDKQLCPLAIKHPWGGVILPWVKTPSNMPCS